MKGRGRVSVEKRRQEDADRRRPNILLRKAARKEARAFARHRARSQNDPDQPLYPGAAGNPQDADSVVGAGAVGVEFRLHLQFLRHAGSTILEALPRVVSRGRRRKFFRGGWTKTFPPRKKQSPSSRQAHGQFGEEGRQRGVTVTFQRQRRQKPDIAGREKLLLRGRPASP